MARCPEGRPLVEDGAAIQKGGKMAEWDPYTIPIISESSGVANYMDLAEGVSFRETVDETTGIASKEVIDWKSQPKACGTFSTCRFSKKMVSITWPLLISAA